jgi:hypothetical protein
MIGEWYKENLNKSNDMYSFTLKQIADYENIAKERRLIWANES